MKQLAKDFLTIGRGAEYVIRGDDSIILIVSGRTLEVATRLAEKPSFSNIVLRDPSAQSAETVVFSGSAQEVMQAYNEFLRQLTKKRGCTTLSILKSLLISAASIAIIAALLFGYVETQQVPSEISAIEESPILQDQTAGKVSMPVSGDRNELSGLKVLKTPDFLKTSDEDAGKNRSEASNTEPHVDQVTRTISDVGLPAYNPDLYKAKETSIEASPAGSTPSINNELEDDIETKQSSNDRALADEAAKTVATSSKEDKTANTEKMIKGEPEATADDEAIKRDADAAVRSLIGNGMTAGDVRKLLINIQQMKASGDEQITPDMLRALPEEVAALLADQGMDLDGPGSGTMNVLPSEVVDQFRGKDGVATIPENYSWYARSGGPVSIPLPGGGDIKHPDDFKDFGLQP